MLFHNSWHRIRRADLLKLLKDIYFPESVIDFASEPPSGIQEGDAYIIQSGVGDWEGHDNEAVFYLGDKRRKYEYFIPFMGTLCYVVNSGNQFLFTGVQWIFWNAASAIQHNDTEGKQGGDGTNYFHLSFDLFNLLDTNYVRLEGIINNYPEEIIWEDVPDETPDGVIVEFSLHNIWIADKIAVYVAGTRVKNGTQVDVTTDRLDGKVTFSAPVPPDVDVYADYEKEADLGAPPPPPPDYKDDFIGVVLSDSIVGVERYVKPIDDLVFSLDDSNPQANLFKPDVFNTLEHIYFAGPPTHKLYQFDKNLNIIAQHGAYGTADGLYNEPEGVSIDNTNGKIYVADSKNNRIQRLAIDSGTGALTFEIKWGFYGSNDGDFRQPQDVSVYLGATPLVAVADTYNYRVQLFDLDGIFHSKFTVGNLITSVTFDSAGSIWLIYANHLYKWTFYDPVWNQDLDIDLSTYSVTDTADVFFDSNQDYIYVPNKQALIFKMLAFEEDGTFVVSWDMGKATTSGGVVVPS